MDDDLTVYDEVFDKECPYCGKIFQCVREIDNENDFFSESACPYCGKGGVKGE